MFWRATLPLFFVGLLVLGMMSFLRENIPYIVESLNIAEPCAGHAGFQPLLADQQDYGRYIKAELASQLTEEVRGEVKLLLIQRFVEGCRRQLLLGQGPEAAILAREELLLAWTKIASRTNERFVGQLLSFLQQNQNNAEVFEVFGGRITYSEAEVDFRGYIFESPPVALEAP